MPQKLRQIVSTLALDIKSLNLDDKVSFRYLADKFTDKIGYFLRLEARSREFTKDYSVWKVIGCVELIDVPTNSCGYFDDCNTLRRSAVKIPESYNTPYGLLIKVLTADGSSKFRQIASNQYANFTKKEYGDNSKVYWLEEGYIYIPNTEIEAVKVMIMPKNPAEVDKLNGDCGACVFPLDGTVNYSDYLITLAKAEVLKELFPRVNIQQDENANDNTNIK